VNGIPFVDWYLRILHLDRRFALDVDLGPLDVHFYGRSVFYMWVTVTILAIAGVAVLASRRRELIQKWFTWVLIALVVGIPFWVGKSATAVLAAALAVVAVIEFSRLVKLRRCDTGVLLALAVLYPLAAWLRPSLLLYAPVFVLAAAVPSVLGGDVEHGTRRSAFTAFGSVWICWSLALLVVLSTQAFVLFFAVAATDVAAWCGGKGLRRLGWARRNFTPLSPNKTIGGVVGATIGAFLVLTLLGTISVGLLVAVAFGGLFGDLLESMVKRQAQVKDAGDWLPGFGGLLDRIDSLLVVLPVAFVLG
jgi:phosphatidate cytidylyltransferase